MNAFTRALGAAVIAASIVSTVPSRAQGGEPLEPKLQDWLSAIVESGVSLDPRCVIQDDLGFAVRQNPDRILTIVEFTADTLSTVWPRDTDFDCACPGAVAAATVSAVPDQAAAIRMLLTNIFPGCSVSIELAMVDTLASLPEEAKHSQVREPIVRPLNSRSAWCRDDAGCAVEPSAKHSANPALAR